MDTAQTGNSEATDVSNLNDAVKKERNFPALDLKDQSTLSTENHPVLVVQSPKTPTLSRKLKAVSLDSEPQQQTNSLEVSRDVFSMPNTPKRQIKQKLSCDFDDGAPKCTLAPSFSSNLKKFASNNSISGSQTLKTLPEINALQDFSDCPIPEPQKVRTKGLLERRGSNASLTIDLGSSQSITDVKPVPLSRLNTAKSVSNLYLSSMSTVEKCVCAKKCEIKTNSSERRNSKTETCGNCTIYESVPKLSSCKVRCQNLKRCNCCSKSRRKSLSNENLYVPPCGFCETENRESPELRNGKGNNRKAVFPRQPDLEASQLLSDDFKMHLQNIQYLQTAGNVLSVEELKSACEISRVPKLHQEFWEVPLNLQEKCYVSGSQSKNRYRGVLPNEHSRVHLPSSGGYIHANYIKGPDYTETAYIATQGPLSHTCTDFWEMVWHSQCKCIVMLTGLVEKGRNKCELYFPLGKKSGTTERTFFYVKTPKVRDKFTFEAKNYTEFETETYEFEEKNEVTFGKYHIKYVRQRDLDECQIRELQLRKTDLNVEARTVYHYWLSIWPDHKMANPEQVLKMAMDVLRTVEGSRNDISGDCGKDDLTTHQSSKSVDCKASGEVVSQKEASTSSRFRFDMMGASEVSIDCSTGDSVTQNSTTKFNFDISEASCSDTTISVSDALYVSESSIENRTTRTFTVSTSSSTVSNQNSTTSISQSSTNTNTNQSRFDVEQSSNKVSRSSGSFEDSSCVFQQIELVGEKVGTLSAGGGLGFSQDDGKAELRRGEAAHLDQETSTAQVKSREGSISDFNKETLSNRCSLDSKLGNLNKMTNLKSQFKREVCVALKSKTSSLERKKSAENVRLPVIVHCSAGIGRTGCFLAILNGIQQLKANVNVDVLAILCSLRLNRGGMVQTAEQYELIHRVLTLYSETM